MISRVINLNEQVAPKDSYLRKIQSTSIFLSKNKKMCERMVKGHIFS